MAVRALEFVAPARLACDECARRLHERLSPLPGLQSLSIDLRHGTIRVDVDDEAYIGRHLGEKIRNALSDLHRATPAEAHAPHRHTAHAVAEANRRRILLVLLGGTAIMALEIVGAVAANSLVLFADAAHYATDLAALLLAFFAITWSMKSATSRKTFGYHRTEVVAAFINAIALWAVSAYLVYEAVQRMRDPPPVEGGIVAVIGATSLAANLGLAALLRRGVGHNLNVRAAYLHIVSDALGSAAALAAGAAVYFWGLHVADPILTLFITVLILAFTWNLTRQTLHILLEGAPAHAHPDEISLALRTIPGVRDIHDLHVWTLASGVDSVSAHIVLNATPTDDAVSHEIHRRLRGRYGINHVTVQLEDPECPCDTTLHGWPSARPGLPL